MKLHVSLAPAGARLRSVFLMAAVLLAGSLVCRADVVTFDFQGIIGSGFSTGLPGAGSASGTVTIDTTAGLVTGLNISASTTSANVNGVTSVTFTTVSSQDVDAIDGSYEIFSGQDNFELILELPVDSLVGYSGGNLCAYSNIACGEELSTYTVPSGGGVAFVTASLTEQTAATPEPGSLALLGSGALGLVGVLRRKKRC